MISAGDVTAAARDERDVRTGRAEVAVGVYVAQVHDGTAGRRA